MSCNPPERKKCERKPRNKCEKRPERKKCERKPRKRCETRPEKNRHERKKCEKNRNDNNSSDDNEYDPTKYDDRKTYSPTELHKTLKHIGKRIKCEYKPIYLTNKDFEDGTYVIEKPGYYVLKEDINFNPLPNHDHTPLKDSKYDVPGFSLGFFAAIVIASKRVYLNLNGHKIEQSKEHALQQRFFAVIELANSPFIPGQGPGNFGSKIRTSRDVIIKNGTIGRSSHHGIHGNFPKRLLIENVTIEDFEVAALALNGSDSVVCNNVKCQNSRSDVPVISTYSASRFARLFAKKLLSDYSEQLSESQISNLQDRLEKLELLMDEAKNEIMETGKTTVKLFLNKTGIPDGNIYSVLFHSPGVAVDDLITENKNLDWTRNVYLCGVHSKNIQAKINEIVGISQKDGKGVQVDVAGSVFRIDSVVDEDGKYVGDELSDLQLELASIALSLGIKLGKSNLTKDLIDWSQSNDSVQTLLDMGYKYKCNGDSMFHVNKGAIGYRFDGVDNMTISNCSMSNLLNYGRLGNEVLDGKYSTSHDQQKRPGYNGSDTIGASFSYCKNLDLYVFDFENIKAANGDSIAISMINKTKCVCMNDIEINGVYAGTFLNDEWKGEDYYGKFVDYTPRYPNPVPNSVGIYLSEDSKRIKLKKRRIKNLEACGCEVPLWSD